MSKSIKLVEKRVSIKKLCVSGLTSSFNLSNPKMKIQNEKHQFNSANFDHSYISEF